MRVKGLEGQVSDQGLWAGSLCLVVSSQPFSLHTHTPKHRHTTFFFFKLVFLVVKGMAGTKLPAQLGLTSYGLCDPGRVV